MAKATKKNNKDALAALAAKPRLVTPRVLQGEERELWEEFVKNWSDGKYQGLSMKDLFDWAKEHLSFNCSISCFRGELLKAAGVEE